MTRGVSTTLPTALPARYERLFPWQLDRRCKMVREVAADMMSLWQDLGGNEALSTQQLWLCERVVFIRRRMLVYETAVMSDAPAPTPFDSGVYSNLANVLQGYLKTLGLHRQARKVDDLQTYLAKATGGAGTAA